MEKERDDQNETKSERLKIRDKGPKKRRLKESVAYRGGGQ